MFTTTTTLSSSFDSSFQGGDPAGAQPGRRVRFRLAGYLFTYRRNDDAQPGARVRIDMWREEPGATARYWVTVAVCAPRASSARKVALALAAWVRSCDVGTKNTAKAQAVAESFAMLRERLAMSAPEATASVRARVVPITEAKGYSAG